MPRCLSAGPPSASDAAARSRAGMHSPYFGNQSDSTVPSTCLLSYLPPSLPGSQIPTVSAHVNSEITGHALTHVCFAFKRVISLCTQAVLGFFFFFLPSFFSCCCIWTIAEKKQSQAGFKAKKEEMEEMTDATSAARLCVMTRLFSVPHPGDGADTRTPRRSPRLMSASLTASRPAPCLAN